MSVEKNKPLKQNWNYRLDLFFLPLGRRRIGDGGGARSCKAGAKKPFAQLDSHDFGAREEQTMATDCTTDCTTDRMTDRTTTPTVDHTADRTADPTTDQTTDQTTEQTWRIECRRLDHAEHPRPEA